VRADEAWSVWWKGRWGSTLWILELVAGCLGVDEVVLRAGAR